MTPLYPAPDWREFFGILCQATTLPPGTPNRVLPYNMVTDLRDDQLDELAEHHGMLYPPHGKPIGRTEEVIRFLREEAQ